MMWRPAPAVTARRPERAGRHHLPPPPARTPACPLTSHGWADQGAFRVCDECAHSRLHKAPGACRWLRNAWGVLHSRCARASVHSGDAQWPRAAQSVRRCAEETRPRLLPDTRTHFFLPAALVPDGRCVPAGDVVGSMVGVVVRPTTGFGGAPPRSRVSKTRRASLSRSRRAARPWRRAVGPGGTPASCCC